MGETDEMLPPPYAGGVPVQGVPVAQVISPQQVQLLQQPPPANIYPVFQQQQQPVFFAQQQATWPGNFRYDPFTGQPLVDGVMPQPPIANQVIYSSSGFAPMQVQMPNDNPPVPLTPDQEKEAGFLRRSAIWLIVFSLFSAVGFWSIMFPLESVMGVVLGSMCCSWTCTAAKRKIITSSRKECCGFGHLFPLAIATLLVFVASFLWKYTIGMALSGYAFDLEPKSLFVVSRSADVVCVLLCGYIISSTAPAACCACFSKNSRRLVHKHETQQLQPGCCAPSSAAGFRVYTLVMVALTVGAMAMALGLFEDGSNYYYYYYYYYDYFGNPSSCSSRYSMASCNRETNCVWSSYSSRCI